MHLTRVVIENYKSIRHCDVTLGKLNYLVGMNGSGKSNFLDALRGCADRVNFRQFIKDGEEFRDAVFNKKVKKTIHLRLFIDGENYLKITAKTTSMVSGEKFRPFFESARFYFIDPNLIKKIIPAKETKNLKSDGSNLAIIYKQTSKKNQIIILDHLQKIVPEIKDIRYYRHGPAETLEFILNDGLKLYPVSMSDGTLRALGILVALFQPNTPSLIGIEEPETGLHPAAAKHLRAALFEASEFTQVIATTHSPELLDDFDITPDMVKLFSMGEDGATVVTELDEAAKKTINRRDLSVGHLLRKNQL